jgi:hypothetical protein
MALLVLFRLGVAHAESVGSHFHEHVKGKYFYTKALK